MLVLIHGGLWEDMDSARFWELPGILPGLRARGLPVLAPDRPHHPPRWDVEVDHLLARLPERPVAILAGSNGCSVAARLAVDHPDRVARLILGWPATAADPRVDAWTRSHLAGLGAGPATVDGLLAGDTLRGLSDDDLAALSMPVSVLPSVPDNPFHQRHTVDALIRIIPGAVELPGRPEPPTTAFPAHLDALLDTVTTWYRSE